MSLQVVGAAGLVCLNLHLIGVSFQCALIDGSLMYGITGCANPVTILLIVVDKLIALCTAGCANPVTI